MTQAAESGIDLDHALVFSPGQTVGEAMRAMTRAFAGRGIEEPARDARILLQGLLMLDGGDLLLHPDRWLAEDATRVSQAARRRLAREPVSRILGKRDFYGREFLITPAVLDPRPDTETVVDLALETLRNAGLSNAPLSIADIGTGSGILIATLLSELPNARGVATDISPDALAVAEENARRLGLQGRVTFVATSGLDGCDGPFDLIVSNPPYIVSGEIDRLEPEVGRCDPNVALDGGADGLSAYRLIAAGIAKLQQHVRLVVEIGEGQLTDVEGLFSNIGGYVLACRRDLGGHIRAVSLEIHPQPF